MWTSELTDSAADRAAWDAFVSAAPDGGVLQCSAWAGFKRPAGWRPCRVVAGDGERIVAGAQVLLRSLPLRLGCIAYCPRGPVGEWRAASVATVLWPALRAALRARRAVFLKVEPNAAPDDALEGSLRDLGLRPSGGHVQPIATLQIDLSADAAAIAAAQKAKTRYNVGLAARKGVLIREGGLADLPAIYPLLAETSRRDGFPIHAAEYYDALLRNMSGVARLTMAHHDGDLLAAIFVAAFGREAIYMYGASGGHKRNLMPTYLIQWEAMQWAKTRGCAFYDMWGIPEDVQNLEEADAVSEQKAGERTEDGLWGVYRFKRGFGGRLVRFAGSFDDVYSPLLYRLWNEALPRYRSLLLRRLGMRDDR